MITDNLGLSKKKDPQIFNSIRLSLNGEKSGR